MRIIEEALCLENLEEIEQEIYERNVLMSTVEGWLYKGVIQQEISMLNKKRWSIPITKIENE